MNIKDLTHILSNISEKLSFINEFKEGDIYENLNTTNVLYPFVNWTVLNVAKRNTTTLEVNGTISYVDRLIEDESNKEDVQTTGIDVINRIVNELTDNYEVDADNIVFTPYTRKFADLCAVISCGVRFTISYDYQCSTIPNE